MLFELGFIEGIKNDFVSFLIVCRVRLLNIAGFGFLDSKIIRYR